MQTLFISDLHLDEKHPHLTEKFFLLLEKYTTNINALYILGDFFEVWIGDDQQTEFINRIKTALKNYTQRGIAVYIMHGNRDFLLGQRFMQETGACLLSDPTVIDLYGTPCLLTHGDSLCIDDQDYIQFRNKVRDIKRQNIFLRLPLFLRRGIARLLRFLSQLKAKQNHEFIDANTSEIKCLVKKFQTKLIIHGHTHRPSIEYFNVEGMKIEKIVLSDWEDKGNMLICNNDGSRRLVYF